MPVTAAQWLCFVAVHEFGIVARWRFNQHPRTSLPIQPEGSSSPRGQPSSSKESPEAAMDHALC